MMASLPLVPSGTSPRVLLLGAHCDDIEIGCGGALQAIVRRHPEAELRWVVLSSTPEREAETRRAAERLLPNVAIRFDIARFRENYFPYIGADVKDYVHAVAQGYAPDLVFTHFVRDKHQDHRTVAELTHNAFRNHLILEYEIVKYDGDLGTPNVFVPLQPEQAEKKIQTVMDAFVSQRTKHWFTADTFRALLRIRGIESNAPSGFAEAFHCTKLRFLQ